MKMMNRLSEENEDIKKTLDDHWYAHRWTPNIPPPSTPKRYYTNEPPFNPADIFGDIDDDDLDDE